MGYLSCGILYNHSKLSQKTTGHVIYNLRVIFMVYHIAPFLREKGSSVIVSAYKL